jgi:hypothetical protein
MFNLMMNSHAPPEQSQSQILPESRGLSQTHSRSLNMSHQNLTEHLNSVQDINHPYIITNASQEKLSRQRNSYGMLDRLKGGSSMDS